MGQWNSTFTGAAVIPQGNDMILMGFLQPLMKVMGKPAIPRVPGANPFRTPDTTVHNPKEQDVELGGKTVDTKP